jgi:hypothetical protein
VELADHAFRVVGGSITALSAEEIPRLRAAAGARSD